MATQPFSCNPFSAASSEAGLWGSTISTLPPWARAISWPIAIQSRASRRRRLSAAA